MSICDISVAEMQQLSNPLYIDLRTPSEWREGNIPQSINLPILNDDERAEVGFVYKQIDHKAAKELAFTIASPKLPGMVSQIKEYSKSHEVVLYCWRGGLRSRAIATILDLLDIKVKRLHGGYKGYRQHILNQLGQYELKENFVVLHGMTGVGKTSILEKLQERGFPTLDLEGFAGHRGSSFGGIGLQGLNTQRQFDSLLEERLKAIGSTPYYIIEAESRRIGKVMIPQTIMEAKQNGLHFIVEAPLKLRAERILKEYTKALPIDSIWDKIEKPLENLHKQLLPQTRNELEEAIRQRQLLRVIEILMVDYYDPKYIHKFKQYQGVFESIDATDLDVAVEQIVSLVEKYNADMVTV